MTPQVAIEILRTNAFRFILGELVFASGLVACILYLLRAKKTDPSTLYFGIASALYGLRLIVELGILETAFPKFPWASLDSGITLVIGIPFVLFWGSTFLRARPWVIRGFIAVQTLLAIAGGLLMLLHRDLRYVWTLNGIVGVVLAVLFASLSFFPRVQADREVRLLRLGLLVFGAFVLVENLAGLYRLRNLADWEPVGMVLFLCVFGYVSARRTLRMEQNWIALRKELDIARQIQLSILPREMPRASALEVAARYLPMHEVAGDFYDFLSVDQERVGILVADVSGHGVPAALIASMVKVAIAAQLPHAQNPAQVLTGMNQILCGKLQGQFVTAAYLFVDTAGGWMRYSAAAHPPMLWWQSRKRDIEAIEENGLMLGFRPQATYAFTEREIGRGDRFLLYTDGLLEASNEAGEFFGAERLSRSMEAARTVGADEFANSLLGDLGRWAGHDQGRPQDDDLTLLVVDCRPPACYAVEGGM